MASVRRGWSVLFLSVLLLAACGPAVPAPGTTSTVAPAAPGPTTPPAAALSTPTAPTPSPQAQKAAEAPTAAVPPSARCATGMKLFKHYYGETCVPEKPQRVIALQDQNVLLPLWELGFRDQIVGSVGALDANGKPFYRRMQQFDTSKVAFIGRYGAPELEKIVALRPDLIVGEQLGTKDDLYQRLAQIAPTVVIEQFSKPIRESSAQFAQLVGREAELATLQGEYDARVLALRTALGNPSKVAVSLMVANEKGPYLEGGGAGATVLRDVGLAVPKQHAQLMAENKFEAYSIERLPDFDGDIILIPTFQQDTYQELLRKFREHPLWQQTNAARKNQIHLIDGELLYGNAYQPLLNFLALLEEHLVRKKIETGYVAAHPDKVATAPPNPYTMQVYGAAAAPTPDRGSRLVKHAMGEARVPASPQRVVVLDTGALANALALGTKPVGADLGGGAFVGYLGNRVEGIQEVVGETGEPNLETILRLKPDLIIGTKALNEQIYDKLQQIAPTVLAEAHPSQEWKAYVAFVGEALGKPQEAGRLLGDYDGRIAEFKRRMGDRLTKTTVSIVRSRPEGVDLYLKKTFAGSVVAEAGLPRPPAQDRAPEKFADNFPRVSLELIPQLDGDVLFWVQRNEKEGAGMKTMMEHPLWSQLNAVKQGRVYEVRFDVWVSGWNIIGANLLLDDLFKHLVEDRRQ